MTIFLGSMVVSMFAFRYFVLPQSQANLSDAIPGSLTIPYLRLRESPEQPVSPDMISVDIMANTGGQRSTGIDVVLEYDAQVLIPLEQLITNSGAFAVIHTQQLEGGTVRFSVFSDAERNEPLVQTNADEEVKIATVTFQNTQPDFELTLLRLLYTPESLDDSNIVLHMDERPEFPVDILKSAGELLVDLKKDN